MNEEPVTFFSSNATKASDGSLLIALFNGGGKSVALLRCSADAAINLIGAIAVALSSGNPPQVPNDH